ncbi:MAG: aminotransferase class I/II-fold pyridoxal phosphate-dependent enzyme, partial [Clostridia bacterium]|nr:aminotransferase class I/II-fold pyridoxal phosphate-dependent enzyme [Clostridia bacterium]
MSRFLSEARKNLTPYTPGEQPQDMKYIKLNTNESPFKPCKAVLEAVSKAADSIQLYPDPECSELTQLLAQKLGVKEENIIINNGSDETLNFAFMAFCDKERQVVFPDITYGFYSVFAELNGVPFCEIPLKEDFSIDINDYIGINKTVFLANPNAPTGIALKTEDIEKIVKSNPDNVIVIDEAYVDFGAESCIP